MSFSTVVARRGCLQPCQPDWESSSWSSKGRRPFLTFTCTTWRIIDTCHGTVEPSFRGQSKINFLYSGHLNKRQLHIDTPWMKAPIISLIRTKVCVTEKLHCNVKQRLTYYGKLSREKTFVNWWKIQIFAEKTSMVCSLLPCQRTPRHNFRRENFSEWPQNHKIHESFLPRKFSAIR